jgi:hypothetical protein
VIRFTSPTGASDNTDTIIVTFPSDFNFTSKTIGTVTFTHGASTGAEITETLAASPSATAWGAVFSGTQNRVLTLTAPSDGVGAGSLAAADKIILTYDNTNSINATTATTFNIAISGTFGDTGSILIQTLTDDQVQVSATVAQTLTFSISDNSIGFGTLSSSAARFATGDEAGTGSEAEAHTLAAPNAASGYTTTLKGATLTSGAATITAIGGSNCFFNWTEQLTVSPQLEGLEPLRRLMQLLGSPMRPMQVPLAKWPLLLQVLLQQPIPYVT